MDELVRMIAQIRELINPDRRGGVSASELGKAIAILRTLESKLTSRAADGFSAEQIATIRRIARDVVSGGGE